MDNYDDDSSSDGCIPEDQDGPWEPHQNEPVLSLWESQSPGADGRRAAAESVVQVTFSTASETPAVRKLLESFEDLLRNKDVPDLPDLLRAAIDAVPGGQVLGYDDVSLAIRGILEEDGTPLKRKEELVRVLLGCDSLGYLHLFCSRPGADVVSAIFQCREAQGESEVLEKAVGLLYAWACMVGCTCLSHRRLAVLFGSG